MKKTAMWMCMIFGLSHAWRIPVWAQAPEPAENAVPADAQAPEAPKNAAPAVAAHEEQPLASGGDAQNASAVDAKEKKEKKEKNPLKFKGDIRYRHESIKKGDADMDHRHRVRMRFGVFSEISENLEAGFQLASGGGDPISTNQTLSPAFTKKPMTIDQAFFQYRQKGWILAGGKMKNPLFLPGGSPLIWDSDLTPEGMVAAYEIKTDSIQFSLLGLAFWNADRKGDEKDSHILGSQARARFDFGGFTLCVAGGFYDFTKIRNYGPLYEGNAFGNTLDAENLYANDYNIVDAGVELKGKMGKIPFSVFGQLALNLAADEEKTGFLAGFSLGDAQKAMGWKLSYNFRSLQKDAVFGTYADSDFIGSGTGGSGHVVSAEFALSDAFLLGATVQLSTIDDGNDTAYTRIQIDASVKF